MGEPRRFGRVAIAGMGYFCAAGEEPGAVLASLFRGERRATVGHPLPDTGHTAKKPVFPCAPGLAPPDGRYVSSAYVERAAAMALEEAGIRAASLAGRRVGVVIGANTTLLLRRDDPVNGGEASDVEALARHNRSNPARALGERYRLSGPALTVANACTAGADAIAIGRAWIEQGRCELVLAGGVDELTGMVYAGFNSLGVMSDGLAAPFDRDRSGTNLGEGAAVCVLVDGERHRGPVAATLRGAGLAGDGFHMTSPDPEGGGLRRAVRDCLGQWEEGGRGLAFIKAHGTGTRHNDAVEGALIDEWFPGVPFFSLKGYLGHTMGASGALEFCLTVDFLRRGEIPGSAGFVTLDSAIGHAPVTAVTPVRGDAALALSLGLGGQNSALLVERGP